MPVLFWGHAALSLAALLARALPERFRSLTIRVLCGFGVGFGIALFLERRSGDAWRTTLLEPHTAAIAGVAAASAWVVVAALPDEDDRARAASLVGLGASALALFAGANWTIPALMFWTLLSIVCGALAVGVPRRVEVWLAIVLADLCLAVAFVGHVLDTDTWELPRPAPGQAFWFVVAAAIIRAGAVPFDGMWRGLGSPGAAAVPLLVGSGFILAAGPGGRTEAWVALALIVVGLGQATWGALSRALTPGRFAGWVSAVCLGLVFAAPEVSALAGAAAVLAAATLAVWPFVSGAARPERGLVLTLAPLTAAFGAIVLVARKAFDLAISEGSVGVRVPWAVIAAVLPLVMATGALLGARVGRERSSTTSDPWPLAATWLVVAGSIGLGLVPGALELPDDVVGTQNSLMTVLLVAIGGGVLAGGLWTLRHPDHSRAPSPEPSATLTGPATSQEVAAYRSVATPLVEKILVLVALVLALAVVGAVGWATYEGLSQGFL